MFRFFFRYRGCCCGAQPRKSKKSRRESKKNGATVTIDAGPDGGSNDPQKVQQPNLDAAHANGGVPLRQGDSGATNVGANGVSRYANGNGTGGGGGVLTNGTTSVNVSLDTNASGPSPASLFNANGTSSLPPPARPVLLQPSATGGQRVGFGPMSPQQQKLHARGVKHSQSTREANFQASAEGLRGSVFSPTPPAPQPAPVSAGVQLRVPELRSPVLLTPSLTGSRPPHGAGLPRSPNPAPYARNSMIPRAAVSSHAAPTIAVGTAYSGPVGASLFVGSPPMKPPRSRVPGSPGPGLAYQTSPSVTGVYPQQQLVPYGTNSLDRLQSQAAHDRSLSPATGQVPVSRPLSPETQQRAQRYSMPPMPAYSMSGVSANVPQSQSPRSTSNNTQAQAAAPWSSSTQNSLPRTAPSPALRPLSPVRETVDGGGDGGGTKVRLSRGPTPVPAFRAASPHGTDRVVSPTPSTAFASIYVSPSICALLNMYPYNY